MKTEVTKKIIVHNCPFCGRHQEVIVNEIDYALYQAGVRVQDAFPYLSADEREIIISGICPKCWDELFKSEEDN